MQDLKVIEQKSFHSMLATFKQAVQQSNDLKWLMVMYMNFVHAATGSGSKSWCALEVGLLASTMFASSVLASRS